MGSDSIFLLATNHKFYSKSTFSDFMTGIGTPNFAAKTYTETLLAQVRNATDADQLAAMSWLLKKYSKYGGK